MFIGARLLFLFSLFLLRENLPAALVSRDEPALPRHGQKERQWGFRPHECLEIPGGEAGRAARFSCPSMAGSHLLGGGGSRSLPMSPAEPTQDLSPHTVGPSGPHPEPVTSTPGQRRAIRVLGQRQEEVEPHPPRNPGQPWPTGEPPGKAGWAPVLAKGAWGSEGAGMSPGGGCGKHSWDLMGTLGSRASHRGTDAFPTDGPPCQVGCAPSRPLASSPLPSNRPSVPAQGSDTSRTHPESILSLVCPFQRPLPRSRPPSGLWGAPLRHGGGGHPL